MYESVLNSEDVFYLRLLLKVVFLFKAHRLMAIMSKNETLESSVVMMYATSWMVSSGQRRIGNSVFPDHCGDDDPKCNKFSFYAALSLAYFP